MFYDNMKKICSDKGVYPTQVMKDLGFSPGNISKWKNGSTPNIDLCVAIAHYLGVSLDYLIELKGTPYSELSDSDRELIDVFSRIPESKRQICIDFLKTHMEDQESSRSKHA